MLRKNIVQTLDAATSWKVFGLDLAKHDLAVVAIPADGSEVQYVKRYSHADFLEFTAQIPSATMVFEPGNGANHFALRLQAQGHTPKTVSGASVKSWITLHMSGQKTDLNDAYALARLSEDPDLKTVRIKSVDQNRLQSLQAMRKQLVEQRTKTIVSIKGIFQCWGILFKKDSRSLKKFKEAANNNKELLGEEVVEAMILQIDRIADLDKDIKHVEELLKKVTMQDPRAQPMLDIPCVGLQTVSRLCAIMGDIKDFETPRSFVAFIGLVPKNMISGNKTTTPSGYEQVGQGKVNRRGDKMARSLIIQCASSMYMNFHKDNFPECALKDWIQKQKDAHKPYGKIMVSLATKLLRIIYTVLKHGEAFSYEKTGISRSALAALKAAQPAEVGNA